MNAERRTPNAEPQLCPQFSIIVPAYNTAKYITKCLDSLINQDIPERNYEIIITDDGSTDETGKICDSYAEHYSFIHVTHTENHGPSHARNVAISQCKGDYLVFCDSDDFVSPQLISVVTRALRVLEYPDVLIYRLYSSRNIPSGGFPNYNVKNIKAFDAKVSNGEELCFKILKDNIVGGFTPNKILRHEIIGDIRFDERLSYCEDMEWFINIFTSKKNVKVCYINYWLYCYVTHEYEGLTRDPSKIYTDDGFPRILYALEKIYALKNLSKKLLEQIKGNFYSVSVSALYAGYAKHGSEVYMKLKNYVKKYAGVYYFKSGCPLLSKVKTFIKLCLTLLHIHKPRRK